MAGSMIQLRESGGFNFDNCYRNDKLLASSGLDFKARKTGTTLAAAIFKDGVVLGADTRATEGYIVAEKNCEKIHYLSDNIYCCGAGTAADTEMTTRMISSQLELHRLNSGRTPRVISALRLLKQFLFQYHGHIGAALILGGVDKTGTYLYGIHPHGSSDRVPYTTMGSGCLAAMSVLEADYKFDMTQEEAMDLVRKAILAGIFNDLGSGSNVDLCVITNKKTDFFRNYEIATAKGVRAASYMPPQGSTKVVKKEIIQVEYDVVSTRVIRDLPTDEQEAMDI